MKKYLIKTSLIASVFILMSFSKNTENKKVMIDDPINITCDGPGGKCILIGTIQYIGRAKGTIVK